MNAKAKTPKVRRTRSTLRVMEEVRGYLMEIADAEGVSLNKAMHIAVTRYHFYPKTTRAVNETVSQTVAEMRAIATRLSACEERENHIISLLEAGLDEGGLERPVQDIARDREEAAAAMKATIGAIPQDPKAPVVGVAEGGAAVANQLESDHPGIIEDDPLDRPTTTSPSGGRSRV